MRLRIDGEEAVSLLWNAAGIMTWFVTMIRTEKGTWGDITAGTGRGRGM
jgi:hypothetical protein